MRHDTPSTPGEVLVAEGTAPARPTLHGGTAASVSPSQRPIVRGRIVEAGSGGGIASARVFCARRPAPGAEADPAREVATDNAGAFVLTGLAAGRWIVIPFHPDYFHPFVGRLFGDSALDDMAKDLKSEELWQEAHTLGMAFDVDASPSPPHLLDLRMERGAHIAGRVLGPHDKPVAGAAVRVHTGYYGPWTTLGTGIRAAIDHLVVTHADERGDFTLGCFPQDLRSIRLGAEARGLLGPWAEPLDLGDAGSVVLRLYEPAAIEGVLLQDGDTPLSGGWVFADSKWPVGRIKATTDAEGRFRLEGLPPTSIELTARRANEHESAVRATIDALEPGEIRRGIELRLEDRYLVSGVLQGVDGTPLPHEYLRSWPMEESDEETGDWGAGWTDEMGRFLFRVESSSAFELWLMTGDRQELLRGDLRAPQRDLVLTTTATPRAILTVRVTDPSGQPIPAFTLKGWPYGGGDFREGDGKDGIASYTVAGSPPYRFLITPRRDEHGNDSPWAPYGWAVEAVPEDPVEIRLQKHAEFYGRILDLEDAPVPGVRLMVDEGWGEREIPVGEDGRFRFRALDPATRAIRKTRLILPSGYRDWSYVLTLHAGEYRDVRVRGGGAHISGRIVLVGEGDVDLGDMAIKRSWTSSENNEDDESGEIRTDKDGQFVLYGIPEDAEITLSAHPLSLGQRGLIAVTPPLVVSAGTTDIVIEVRLGATIRGRISGPGLADLRSEKLCATVLTWFGAPDLRLDYEPPSRESPTFRIRGVPPGSHRVALIDRSDDDRLLAWTDGVQAGSDDVVLHVPRLEGVIKGQLLVEGLDTVERVTVVLRREDGSGYELVARGSVDGTFTVDRLDPSIRYSLYAGAYGGGQWVVAARQGVMPGEPVTLKPAPPLSIAGRVEGFKPRTSLVVMVAGTGIMQWRRVDEQDGTFSVGGLVEGEYELTLMGPESQRLVTRPGIRAGTEGVVIEAP